METAHAPRGHWPAGKRRHDEAQAGTILASLRELLAERHTGSSPADVGARVSVRAVAAAVGVSDRTVRRWLAGEDVPAPDAIVRLRRWIAARRKTR